MECNINETLFVFNIMGLVFCLNLALMTSLMLSGDLVYSDQTGMHGG